MKISELIKILEEIKEENGDLDIFPSWKNGRFTKSYIWVYDFEDIKGKKELWIGE